MLIDIIPHLCIWPESKSFQTAQTSENTIIPCLKFTDELPDEMSTAVLRLCNRTPQRPPVAVNLTDAKTLIECGHLKTALNLTTKLLKNYSQKSADAPTNNSIYLFDIWSLRFQLLMALRMYNVLLEELVPFGELDTPDTYLQFYPEYQPHTGSIIPFALRLIHTEALLYSTEPWTAFNRIHRLEENTKNVIFIAQNLHLTESQLYVWYQRLESVQFLKARIFYKLKRFEKAFSVYESILDVSINDEPKRQRLLSALIRMALAVGSSKRVNKYLENFLKLNISESEKALYQSFKAIFYGTYEYAQNNTQKSSSETANLKYCNNEAISLLYNGKVEESLNLLNQHVGPLIEPVAINMTTISDLASTSNTEILNTYFRSHCDNVSDMFDPKLIKIET